VIDFCGGKYPPRFVLWHHDPSTEIGRGMELSCIVTIINKAAMMSSKYYTNKTVNKMAIRLLFFSCKRKINFFFTKPFHFKDDIIFFRARMTLLGWTWIARLSAASTRETSHGVAYKQ